MEEILVSAAVILLIVYIWTGSSSEEIVLYFAQCNNDIAILPMQLDIERAGSIGEGWQQNQTNRADCNVKPQCYGPISHRVSGTGGRILRA